MVSHRLDFVVKHMPAEGEGQLIDVYDGALPFSKEEAGKRVQAYADRPLKEEDLAPPPAEEDAPAEAAATSA